MGRRVVTTAEVMDARTAAGWVSPVEPLEPGDLRCVFDQRGVWEWLVHPNDAAFYQARGIVVNGVRYRVAAVDSHPLLNAVQIRARADSPAVAA